MSRGTLYGCDPTRGGSDLKIRPSLAGAALVLSAATAAAEACGAVSPCEIDGGTYRAMVPDDAVSAPMVLYLHGYAASGEAAMARQSLTAAFASRGWAVVAPEGVTWPGQTQRDWGVDDGHDWPRNDVAFLRAVVADATARFDLDPDRVLVAGYSRGGSMVWDLACTAPDMGVAFASQSGGFWAPLPKVCAGPVHLHHMHGLADRTVPVDGRRLDFAGQSFHQANVWTGMETWREMNGCWGAAHHAGGGDRMVRTWACDAGSLTLVLGEFGHGRQDDWPARVAEWFAAIIGE